MILERTSGLEPASETTDPRYLKLVTVPSFCLSYLYLSLDAIGAVCHKFGLLVTDLHLIPCTGFVETSTRSSSSCSSSTRASMSPANRRLVIFLPSLLTFTSYSSRASDMIRSRKMLKRAGDKRHPCLTPTVVLNYSPMLPFIWTALVTLSQSCSMVRTRFALILYFRIVAHNAACHTLSKCFFFKSMKIWYRIS